MISDLDMLKQILVKDFDNFSDHAVSLVCPSCCFRPLEICRRAWLYCNYMILATFVRLFIYFFSHFQTFLRMMLSFTTSLAPTETGGKQ